MITNIKIKKKIELSYIYVFIDKKVIILSLYYISIYSTVLELVHEYALADWAA